MVHVVPGFVWEVRGVSLPRSDVLDERDDQEREVESRVETDYDHLTLVTSYLPRLLKGA